MSDIQKIKLKRTQRTLSQLQSDQLDFGEPLCVKDNYFIVGKEDSSTISSLNVIKAQRQEIVNNSVFYSGDITKAQLKNDRDPQEDLLPLTTATNVSYGNSNVESTLNSYLNGTKAIPKATNATNATNASHLKTSSATSKCFILGVVDTSNDSNKAVYHAGALTSASENKNGIYFTTTGILVGAAWNDFAEYRECEVKTPGICVVEKGDGTLISSRNYRLPAAYIISDTYGMVIGDDSESDNKVAVAVAGRVLAFVENKEKIKVGDALKTAPGGRLARMSRREIRKYPDRIVGYVSEIPTYDMWNGVNVNDRIWVKI